MNTPPVTKQEVRDMAEHYGCEHRYEGEIKTMFIIGVRANEAIKACNELGVVPFEMKAEQKRIAQSVKS